MTDETQKPQPPSPDSAPGESAPSPALENFLNAVVELDQIPVGAFRDRAVTALDVLFREPEPPVPPEPDLMQRLMMVTAVMAPLFAQLRVSDPFPPYRRPCGCGGATPPFASPAPEPEPVAPAAPMGVAQLTITELLGLTPEQKAQIEALITPEQKARVEAFGFAI